MAGLKTKFEQFVINKVREKRLEMNLSQDDLALMLDLSRGYIGQVESPNHPAKYNMNHINHLAKEFKCSPKDFFPDKPTNESFKKGKPTEENRFQQLLLRIRNELMEIFSFPDDSPPGFNHFSTLVHGGTRRFTIPPLPLQS